MRRSKYVDDWRDDQADYDYYDDADYYEEGDDQSESSRPRSSSIQQRPSSHSQGHGSEVASVTDVPKPSKASARSQTRSIRSASFDVPPQAGHVSRGRSMSIETSHKSKVGVWQGVVAKKVVDKLTPLPASSLLPIASFLIPSNVSNLCIASKKLEEKLTSGFYWRGQLQPLNVEPCQLWGRSNIEKLARKCFHDLHSYGSHLQQLRHAAVEGKRNTPAVVKLLPIYPPHVLTAFKESGEVAVWNLGKPLEIREVWSYLTGGCEAVAASENGRLLVQTTKASSIVVIDVQDIFSDDISCSPVTHAVGVNATAIAIPTVNSSNMDEMPGWVAITGKCTRTTGTVSIPAVLEIIDVLSGDCKSRFTLPSQAYFAHLPFTMTALKHKVCLCFNDGRVCIYDVRSGTSQSVAAESPPIYECGGGAGHQVIMLQKLSGNRGYVAATQSQLLRCAFNPPTESGGATRAKAAVVSDPGRSSPSITPVITALKVTDTTVVCARTGSLVSLEAFDLKGMTTIFSYTRDSMENVVDVDFDELKLVVLLENRTAEIIFWSQVKAGHAPRNTFYSLSLQQQVPAYIPTHEKSYLNSGALFMPDDSYKRVVLGRNMIVLATKDGFRVIWERTKQHLKAGGEHNHECTQDADSDEDDEQEVKEDEEAERRRERKREKQEARRRHDADHKKKDKQKHAARREKYT